MAKAPGEAPQTQSQPQIAAIAVAATAGGDSRSIILQVPMTDGTKQAMKRTDYIRHRWGQKASRGTIRAEVSKLQDKDVPYQVIFGATKGIPGGPDKVAKPEGASSSDAGDAGDGGE